jgi:DNA repair photolyase
LTLIEFPGRPVIEPCSLEYYDHTFAAYVGCQHRCLYCYTQNAAGLDWDNEIGIIPDFREQLAETLGRLPAQAIYVGGDTDPYQPLEADLRYTRQALELMAERGFSGSILTKSPLFVRDIDILKAMPEPSVGISIAFDDETTRCLFETDAEPTSERLEALRSAKEAGIATYALICPVFPRLTDARGLVEAVSPIADRIWVYSLNMESGEAKNWRRVEAVMDEHFPDLKDDLESIVFSRDHPFWKDLRMRLEELKRVRSLSLEIFV